MLLASTRATVLIMFIETNQHRLDSPLRRGIKSCLFKMLQSNKIHIMEVSHASLVKSLQQEILNQIHQILDHISIKGKLILNNSQLINHKFKDKEQAMNKFLHRIPQKKFKLKINLNLQIIKCVKLVSSRQSMSDMSRCQNRMAMG